MAKKKKAKKKNKVKKKKNKKKEKIVSWWNKKRQPVKTIKIKPTLGNKLTKEYKKKLKIKRRGK